ncbi:TPA: lysis system o-spanin lipoprotein Rz1 [Salmonella enterica]
MLLVAGCASKDVVQCQPVPHPPAPAAWAMLPPSNSLTLLDETFSVSDPELSATRQN